MKNINHLISTALASLIALNALPATAATQATEKCYGIAKAHKNDCAAGVLGCGGNAKKDSDPNAYLNVPKGLCAKIVGGSLKPKADE